jgi:DnaK suppressor protein
MLEGRRRELIQDLHGRMRGARADSANDRDAFDQGEISEIDVQDELQFALIQMKADTLNMVDAALRRVDDGAYGDCFECGRAIAEARLRALPFAVRCKDCEEAREMSGERERSVAQRRASSPLFFDPSTSARESSE